MGASHLTITKFFLKPLVILTVIGVGLISCNDKKNSGNKDIEINKEPTISTFYLIRHAEKDRTDPNNADPELNQDGLGRAMNWANILDNIPLDALYSTNFERTRMTAAPVSVKQDLDIDYYDPSTMDIETFKKDNSGLQVLIVGHSNTTPNMVNKLLGEEKYSPLDDTNNGALFIVQIVDGVATDIRLQIN